MIWEILVLAIGALALLAKRRRKKRKFRPYLKGQIEIDLALGTLAADTAVTEAVGDTVTEQAWLSSVKCVYALQDFTATTGDGPIVVGVAHSDYTQAEIEEWIENSSSWERYDLIAQEVAKRKIRRIGTFQQLAAAENTEVLNDGRPITTKCGWMLGTGQTVQFWAYNVGLALQTGSQVQIRGHANLWPSS